MCVYRLITLRWILEELVLFLHQIIHHGWGKAGFFGNVKEVILR